MWMQKKWFRLLIWMVTTSFFFAFAAILISMFRFGPTEQETMSFMMGMMKAMETSLMGLSMHVKEDTNVQWLMYESVQFAFPLLAISIAGGVYVRCRRKV
ncbi:hypothetical protein J2Z22_003489 [Paenibacillus forsythiae]|uniref:DUF4199 domain-containing protein n=1 Tax=Paenibacillus forsythiae TaxID=365616 RepID=A0ABU3HAR3_9BACL|nr:hypothetical protein [Paenibacillus forsythiae]MDT3427913.1 hypothetical protein [Paenibacillus forsythiae]